MITTTIELHDQDVRAAFARLLGASRDLTPAMKAIGERLAETTKRRFETSTGPDGRRWAPNSQATLEALLSRGSGQFSAFTDIASRKQKLTRSGTKAGYFRKDGRLGAKGAGLLTSKKPLIGKSKRLSTEINYQASATQVTIGSPMEYAAVHQFGVLRGALGRTKRGSPIPWGDIPARPFLGVSEADKADILEILQNPLLGRT